MFAIYISVACKRNGSIRCSSSRMMRFFKSILYLRILSCVSFTSGSLLANNFLLLFELLFRRSYLDVISTIIDMNECSSTLSVCAVSCSPYTTISSVISIIINAICICVILNLVWIDVRRIVITIGVLRPIHKHYLLRLYQLLIIIYLLPIIHIYHKFSIIWRWHLRGMNRLWWFRWLRWLNNLLILICISISLFLWLTICSCCSCSWLNFILI